MIIANIIRGIPFMPLFIINIFKVNAERKSKVDDNTAKMQSIKWLGV